MNNKTSGGGGGGVLSVFGRFNERGGWGCCAVADTGGGKPGLCPP